jgi:hypothetical protein
VSEGPRKIGDSTTLTPRMVEIRERLAELRDLMGEYEGELTIRATKTDGEWEQWRIAHPARDEDEPGHKDDLMLTGGCCNADDLIADLATYVVAWKGEPLESGDFEALNLLRPDKKRSPRPWSGCTRSATISQNCSAPCPRTSRTRSPRTSRTGRHQFAARLRLGADRAPRALRRRGQPDRLHGRHPRA